MKSYYEFNGNWLHIFDKLVGIITPGNIRQFTIWEHKAGGKANLLIVHGINLSMSWETIAGVNRISEHEFLRNYKSKMKDHVIHGSHPNVVTNKGFLSFVVKTINNMFII